MARRLKPTDAGYVALFLGCGPEDAVLDAGLVYDLDASNCELNAYGEGAETVRIDSTAGLHSASGLGFVAGWSQKKG